MKKGSLVVCIDNSKYTGKRLAIPQMAPTIYTVREVSGCMCGCGKGGLLFEELKNETRNISPLPFLDVTMEPMYRVNDFKELKDVLPPIDINLEELIGREEQE